MQKNQNYNSSLVIYAFINLPISNKYLILNEKRGGI